MTFTIDNLRAAMPAMTDWERDKADNLCQWYLTHNCQLTDKQWAFAKRLVQATKSKPVKACKNVGNMSKLIDLFNKAKQHLKWPKISLEVNGHPVKLSLAGERAKVPGSITVTDGGPFGANRYYGRVDPDGTWHKPYKQFAELPDVEGLLTDMSTDPAATAAKHGHLTGNCCFCHRPLSDAKSTAVGYGPTCAANYGLPWGKP